MSPALERKINKLVSASLDLPNCHQRHFSFIVKRSTIVSFGWNKSYKTHPLAAKWGHRFSDIHSELSAIANFPYHISELNNYDFINVRVRRDNGLYGYSAPCLHCTKMLIAFGITSITYVNRNSQWQILSL